MSYVRYRSLYYNTDKTSVLWRIDIHDTTADSGTLVRFQSTKPEVNFEGLPETLNPGIFPTSITLGMFIRTSPIILGGVGFGATQGFITDLFTQPEGTYFIKLYKSDVFQGIFSILVDQCNYEDHYPPYLLTIEAADGMYRWGTEKYVSKIGQIKRVTLKREVQHSPAEFTEDPVTVELDGTVLEGDQWVMIEHIATLTHTLHNDTVWISSSRATTYARYQQYSVDSPGDGWVDQGGSLWAKELTHSNEIIVDEDDLYHLTRDIDDTPFRSMDEFLRRAMAVIPNAEEYGADPMYDVVDTWYETRMPSFTADPTTMTRVSEEQIATGKTWNEALTELARHRFWRIYYSTGRIHIEQISERAEVTIKRHKYDFEGTSLGSEDVTLDLSYTADDIKAGEGGQYKIMGALKNVLVTQKLQDPNLLAGVTWLSDTRPTFGADGAPRNLGRITKTESDMRLSVQLGCTFLGIFDAGTWFGLSDEMRLLSTANRQYVHIRVRVRNIDLDESYHLTPTEVNNEPYNDSTWEIEAPDAYFDKYVTMPGITDLPTVQADTFTWKTVSEELPGSVGDTFDVYVSVHFRSHFAVPPFAAFWTQENPTKFYFRREAKNNSLITVNEEEEAVNADAVRAYDVPVDPDNSLTIEMEAKFGDRGGKGEYMEIYTGTKWIRSGGWARNGVGTPVEFLMLLAKEISSLRLLPVRIFSGSFLTTKMTTENRILRGSLFYLPLTADLNTDEDEISGDFINIARTTPPAGNTVVTPFEIVALPVLSGDSNPGETPSPPVFETNEIITAASNLTECDIINTSEVFVLSGTRCEIVHPTEPLKREFVTLTQNVLHDSTVMHFTAHTFLYTFPDASLIIPRFDITQISKAAVVSKFYFFYPVYTGSSIPAPNFVFYDPIQAGPMIINANYHLKRNGNYIYYNGNASTPAEKIRSYYYDEVTHEFLFWLPLAGETIEINAVTFL